MAATKRRHSGSGLERFDGVVGGVEGAVGPDAEAGSVHEQLPGVPELVPGLPRYVERRCEALVAGAI